MTTFTISYEGQTATRNSKARVYNFASVVQSPEGEVIVGWQWSGTYKGAEKCLHSESLANGWRVLAVIPCHTEGQEPAKDAAQIVPTEDGFHVIFTSRWSTFAGTSEEAESLVSQQ